MTLTERQTAVLRGVAAGMTDAEIGRRLGISRRTVTVHMEAIRRRLGARNRTHAVALMDDRDRRWRSAA